VKNRVSEYTYDIPYVCHKSCVICVFSHPILHTISTFSHMTYIWCEKIDMTVWKNRVWEYTYDILDMTVWKNRVWEYTYDIPHSHSSLTLQKISTLTVGCENICRFQCEWGMLIRNVICIFSHPIAFESRSSK